MGEGTCPRLVKRIDIAVPMQCIYERCFLSSGRVLQTIVQLTGCCSTSYERGLERKCKSDFELGYFRMACTVADFSDGLVGWHCDVGTGKIRTANVQLSPLLTSIN